MKTKTRFYHAGCPVCVEAEESLARSLDLSYPARPGPVLRSARPGSDYLAPLCAVPGPARPG